MALDWYPWYAADYRRDTLHLTLAEDGAYRRLIDEYMAREGPLPDSDIALARILGVTLDEWLAVAPGIRPFFRKSGSFLKNPRCDKELHARALLVHSKRIHAKKAAEARWEKDNKTNGLDAGALHGQCAGNADAMPNDATLHYTTEKTDSSFAGPREEGQQESGLPRKEARQVGLSLEDIVRAKGWAP